MVPPAAVPRGPPAVNADDTPSFTVPAVMEVAPVYVFTPLNVQVPVPFLTTEVGVDIIPDIVPELPAAPSKVKANAPVPTVPLQVRVPVVPAAVMVAAAPKVMAPIIVEAAAPVLVNAPAGDEANPVPFKATALEAALVNENPLRSSTAPEATVVTPAVVPRGPAVETVEDAPSFNVPALMVVAPV